MAEFQKIQHRKAKRYRPKRALPVRWVVAAVAVGALLGLAIVRQPASILPHAPSRNAAAHFGLCYTGAGTNCVVDGDTFWSEGVKIRVADIDAPETHPPRCPREANLGNRATLRLRDLLNAGPFELETIWPGTDRYGRALRRVMRDGQSLGTILVSEGLARQWNGSRQPWC